MVQKIPATVVTGFLGAGKTTLIRHMLANANGKRIALIINEFGDLGVDGEILKGCGIENCREDDVVELSNGCICCTVAEDFIPALQKLIDREEAPDHIVIETSGLALPQPLVRAFNWPDIHTRVTVDGVVTVVDGPATAAGQFAHDIAAVDRQRQSDDGLDHQTPLSELFEDQLACADMIIVNKADILGADGVSDVSNNLKSRLRAGVQVLQASHGAIDPRILLGLGIAVEDDLDARHEIHHHHDDDDHDGDQDDHHEHEHGHDEFDSFVVSLPEISEMDGFLARVQDAISDHGVLRLKGFAAVPGKPMRMVIQAVGPRIDTHFDRAFGDDETRATRLVVIGQRGLDQAAITSALEIAAGA